MKKISIVVPCHNEELGIGKVITSVPVEKLKAMGFVTEVIVVDSFCTDRTAEIAASLGATVYTEKRPGKGLAMQKGFSSISKDTDYVVMLDGDNTYRPSEIPRLIEPLESGFCDVIVGSRLEGKITGEALSFSHRLANWFFTFFARQFYKTNMTDTCTGYFAWKKEVIDKLIPHIESKGFAIEAEMITKMSRLGYEVYSVPITYDKREGESNLSPLMDGIKITLMLIKNLVWKPKVAKIKRAKFSLFRRLREEISINEG